MTCYLIRHGKDDPTVRGGWSKLGLTAEGKQQAEDLANDIFTKRCELAITKIFSSDLPRATETANPIAHALGLPVVECPQFRETNNGIFAGMPNELALEKYPGVFWNTLAWDETYPDGESPLLFYERIKSAWEAFSDEMLQEAQNVALVTHGGVIHAIQSLIRGVAFSNKTPQERIPHAALIPLRYQRGRWVEGE
ncbi:MAG: histidine phosphatase family protein [Oscillospiraceae bacterium]|nr:histidine phosphatase family protein [Oscillospiraceae bacterium]